MYFLKTSFPHFSLESLLHSPFYNIFLHFSSYTIGPIQYPAHGKVTIKHENIFTCDSFCMLAQVFIGY
jgi:hypothetical protein